MQIEIRSADGRRRQTAGGEDRAVLVFDGTYEEGDCIAFTGLMCGRFYQKRQSTTSICQNGRG